jgi:hypothetical protein
MMRKLFCVVILIPRSREKDLTQAGRSRKAPKRDPNFVGEIPPRSASRAWRASLRASAIFAGQRSLP